jgi:hypothetical protein
MMTPDRVACFLTELRVARLDDKYWRLIDLDLRYQDPSGTIIVVPVGFVTDFASVPRWLPIAYALTGGTAQPAAVIHDWLYQTHAVDRATADRVLWDAMGALGEPLWRQWAMYRAVRLFGHPAYNSGPSRFRMSNLTLRGGTRLLVIPAGGPDSCARSGDGGY